jgi:hypothetical protein
MGSLDHQAQRVLDRIELRFGIDAELRRRLFPAVKKMLALGPKGEERTRLLRLVAEAYAHQVKVREIIQKLERDLRRRVADNYCDLLGIEPPNIDP